MKRSDAMRDVLRVARSDIKLIGELSSDGDGYFESKAATPPPSLSAQEAAELQSVREMLIQPKKPGVRTTIQVSKNVSQIVGRLAGSVLQRTFFSEMALIYLVSRLEAFLKDYLQEALLQDPRRMRSGTQLTYEQALRFRSMSALRRALAEREAEALGYKSIDDMEKALNEKLGVRLSDFPKWQEVREIVYRRNLVVHNRGVINDIYRSKIGFRGREKHLETDIKYVQTASLTVLDFIDFIDARIGNAT